MPARNLFGLIIAACLASASTAAYQEAPILRELVERGELPDQMDWLWANGELPIGRTFWVYGSP